MTAYTPTVYIVDDDPGMLESTAWLLESVGIRHRTFPNGAAFLDALEPQMQGCVLLDVRMPGMGGLNVQEALRGRKVSLPVIFISGHADVPMVIRAFRGGASDFIEKPFNEQELLDSVQRAIEKDRREHARTAMATQARERFAQLTPRERDLVAPLINGLRSREIAEQLGVGARTVELYRGRVMQKLQVRNVAELVRLAVVAGIHDPFTPTE